MKVEYDQWVKAYRLSSDTTFTSFKERLEWCVENITNEWAATFWAYSGDNEWWEQQLRHGEFFELNFNPADCMFVFYNSEDAMKYRLSWE